MEVLMDEDAEVDQSYARGLIQNVIQNISEPEDEIRDTMAPMTASTKQVAIKQAPPEFELKDIMGIFEIDDLGNFIIIRGPNGTTDLYDKEGRKVNRRGYLCDRFGNVINTKGDIIFK